MERHTIQWHYNGTDYTFHTQDSLFSYRQVDKGTLQMLNHIQFPPDGKILDLGCGYGVVGICAARTIGPEHVVMSDTNPTAIQMAAQNAKANHLDAIKIIQSNGFENIREYDFTLILSNPPYHTDFSVAKGFIEGSYKHLQTGRWLVMVTKRFDWYKNKIQSVFGGVKWISSEGYYVFMAQKRSLRKSIKPKKEMSKKLSRKYKPKH